MSATTHRTRTVLALFLAASLAPAIAQADEDGGLVSNVVTTLREIDQAGGVGAYLQKQVSDHAESGARSVLSVLPGNADDVADAGEHTYSFMDRATNQIEHMIDTGSTDGLDTFWNETAHEAGEILYDKLVPDVVKDAIDEGRELGDNANWVVDKGKEMFESGGEANDPLSTLDAGYLSAGGNDLPGNGGYSTSDFDGVLSDLGESPTPSAEDLKGLSQAASSSMTGGDTYTGYDALPNEPGGAFSDSFQASTAKAFQQAEAQAKKLVESSQPTRKSAPEPSPVTDRTPVGPGKFPDCDFHVVMAKVKNLLPTLDELNHHDKDPCDASRRMIDVAKRQLAAFEGCSVDGPLGAIRVPVQKLLDKGNAELQACLERQKSKPQEDPGGPHCIEKSECVRWSTYLNCEIHCQYDCIESKKVKVCN